MEKMIQINNQACNELNTAIDGLLPLALFKHTRAKFEFLTKRFNEK